MAPTIHQEIGLRRDPEVTPPAVLPEGLESPLNAALPRTVAGRQRMAPSGTAWPQIGLPRTLHLDWAEIGVLGLIITSAVLSVYRLFWAIQL